MTTAEQVLAVARTQIGTVEARDGSNKYGAFYGVDRVAWCAQFQWWVFNQASAAGLIPKTAYTPTFYGWFQSKGQASKTPAVGSLVFYDWPDSVRRIQHVGIVEAVHSDGSITTIEGNTTSGAAGDQSAGGGVWRRRRATSSVVGYGRPAYSAAAPTPAPRSGAAGLPTLTYGMRGNPFVVRLQKFLNAFGWVPELPLLPATGNYLEQTKDVIRRAQAQMGVTGPDADGSIVGARTNAALWARGYRG